MPEDESTRLTRLEVKLETILSQLEKVLGSLAVVGELQTAQALLREENNRLSEKIQHLETVRQKQEDILFEKVRAAETAARDLGAKFNTHVARLSGIVIGASGLITVLGWVLSNNVVSALTALKTAGPLLPK